MAIEWKAIEEQPPAQAGEKPFCVNCKHYLLDSDGDNMCAREDETRLNLVTGQKEAISDPCFCSDERDECNDDDDAYCGSVGRFFVAK